MKDKTKINYTYILYLTLFSIKIKFVFYMFKTIYSYNYHVIKSFYLIQLNYSKQYKM
jgi:hypothetical protein